MSPRRRSPKPPAALPVPALDPYTLKAWEGYVPRDSQVLELLRAALGWGDEIDSGFMALAACRRDKAQQERINCAIAARSRQLHTVLEQLRNAATDDRLSQMRARLLEEKLGAPAGTVASVRTLPPETPEERERNSRQLTALEQLQTTTEAIAELEPQLRAVDTVRSAFRRHFGGAE